VLAVTDGTANLVREEGFEPPRAYARQVLSLLRLPVPPFPRIRNRVYHARHFSGVSYTEAQFDRQRVIGRGHPRWETTHLLVKSELFSRNTLRHTFPFPAPSFRDMYYQTVFT
jgi:hypothetical protein